MAFAEEPAPAEGRQRPAPASPGRRERGRSRRVTWAVRLAPLLLLTVILALQLAGDHWTILELTVLSPLLAATLSGPPLTAVYTVLALAGTAVIGLYEGLFTDTAGGLPAQVTRLVGVALGGAMVAFVSRYNTRRETKLRDVTRVAEVAQRAVLPPAPTAAGDLRLAVRYESAAAEAMVGGDLYEVVDSPWGTRLLVGDVRGKGLDAVRIASRVLGCFRLVAKHRPGLDTVLIELDEEVADVSDLDDFVTAVLLQVRDGQLDLVNAGHPDPFLVRGAAALPLAPVGRLSPLGLVAGNVPITTVPLRPGDRLLLYTDGIAEARSAASREFFPLSAAVEAALGRSRPLDDCLDDLVRRVQEWTGSRLSDDVALLAVELCAPAATPA